MMRDLKGAGIANVVYIETRALSEDGLSWQCRSGASANNGLSGRLL